MKTFSTSNEWIEIISESHEHPVVIFKHSDTCPISAKAHQKVLVAESVITAPIYKIIVQNGPELKIQIADDVSIHHESPQVIILRNGEAVYHASHYAINSEEIIKKYLQSQI